MAKRKSSHSYELELQRMIKERTGAKCEAWLLPQVRATAANMVIIDKIQEELISENSLVVAVSGSMGQQKIEVNPLVAYYDKMQRTLLMQFEALGLNYRTMPTKVTESTKKGVDEDDPMAEYYRQR